MIQLIAPFVMAGLSRLHGMDNKIPKVLESTIFGFAAVIVFAAAHGIGADPKLLLVAIGVALAKHTGYGPLEVHRAMITLGKVRYYPRWRQVLSGIFKGTMMLVPFIIYMPSNLVLLIGLPHLYLAYEVGYQIQKRYNISKTIIGELLGGFLFGILLTITI